MLWLAEELDDRVRYFVAVCDRDIVRAAFDGEQLGMWDERLRACSVSVWHNFVSTSLYGGVMVLV